MALTSSRLAHFQRLQQAAENNPAIRHRENGFPVAVVQQCLVDLGYEMPRSTRPDSSLDGMFGGETVDVVQAFQRKHSLTDDGVVGRLTLAVLDTLFERTSGIVGPSDEPNPGRPRPRGELKKKWKKPRLQPVNAYQRNAIANVLKTDPAISRIDFHLGVGERIHIDARRLAYVGDLIQSKQIHVYRSKNLANAAIGGVYYPEPNVQIFDFYELLYINSPNPAHRAWIRSTIVHEATHIANDISRRRILVSWDEAAAYIAGHIYLRYHNQSSLFTSDQMHSAVADVVAEHQMHRRPGVRLQRHDIRKILPFTRGKKKWERGTGNGLSRPSKHDVMYMPLPRGKDYCARCTFFTAGGTCKAVEGKINPGGHCLLYTG